MGNLYYVGKRHSRFKRGRKRRFFLRGLLIFLALFLLCNFTLYPHISALAESNIERKISSIAASKIAEILEVGEYRYDDLIHISYTADGRVSSVSVDTVALGSLQNKMALSVLSSLAVEDLTVSIPLSNMFGIVFFSRVGGELPIKVRTAESMTAGFVSALQESGINQTKHTISFQMEIGIYYLLPTLCQKMTVNASFCAAETVIVGEVPDSFTNIHRLTDDVSEYQIDDAVDFGDVVY
jgi:sporulation protein YunB